MIHKHYLESFVIKTLFWSFTILCSRTTSALTTYSLTQFETTFTAHAFDEESHYGPVTGQQQPHFVPSP